MQNEYDQHKINVTMVPEMRKPLVFVHFGQVIKYKTQGLNITVKGTDEEFNKDGPFRNAILAIKDNRRRVLKAHSEANWN